MQKLVPCPFCGSTNLELFRVDSNYDWDDETFHEYYTIRCMKCDARGPKVDIGSVDGKIVEDEAFNKAAQDWNKRI